MTFDPKTATPAELQAELARLRDRDAQTRPGEHEQVIDGYAWCTNYRCPGMEQSPVKVIRKTIVQTLGDLGGNNSIHDRDIVVNGRTYIRLADEADAVCPTCQGPRDCGDQLRPDYGANFGGPDALLRVRQTGQTGATRESVLAAAAEAKSRPPTARETLDMRFVNGKIEEAEYIRKLQILGEDVPAALQTSEAA